MGRGDPCARRAAGGAWGRRLGCRPGAGRIAVAAIIVRPSTGAAVQTERYDPTSFEPELAERWEVERTYDAHPPAADPSHAGRDDTFYALTMFPYPSGDLHMGHAEIFTIHDALVRHLRMTGHRVLNPMGWDAFGLPAENAARQRGADPKAWTYANIEEQRRTIVRLGYSFDWDTVLRSCDPEYYRWTQWVFLELFEAGLAYRREALVNWDPVDRTVLANEQVIDGRGERSGALVERIPRTQWFFRITRYADELLDGLDTIDWPERVKNAQRAWIGRSEGAEVTFTTADDGTEVLVYTTRPDTLYGATYFVFAPEHPLVVERMAGDAEYEAFREEVSRRSDIERLSGFGDEPRPMVPATDAGPRRAKRGCACPSTSSTPSTAGCCPPTPRTTCSWTTAPARSWPSRRTTSATSTSPARRASRSGSSSPPTTAASSTRDDDRGVVG
jgi:hypothetical protein